jgi:hypothetical protein
MGYIMKQLEIDFFFPLTEQIPLDLDFTPCQEYELQKRKEKLSTSITNSMLYNGSDFTLANIATNNAYQLVIQPSNEYVGHWNISQGVEVRRPEKPNWVVRKFSELLLGWKWKDK